ncbi:hypothetical protein PHAVU_008G142600 [Phaseolus vulgaris]|uniref:Uncharacterized protein n=1 Tax=Phaseolus vulgaris TaxID=3885 RepID=V7B4G4_PHAVU|nr:hypothetical protein PHAVU_008G142600g [Phaseolus vulgaris]ESW12787.1 hypothetical protein PHAVU_008G142600g [Phaseolus vulgaris]
MTQEESNNDCGHMATTYHLHLIPYACDPMNLNAIFNKLFIVCATGKATKPRSIYSKTIFVSECCPPNIYPARRFPRKNIRNMQLTNIMFIDYNLGCSFSIRITLKWSSSIPSY